MSHTASSSSSFRPIFDNALKAYESRTKKDLLKHPLAAQLQACNSPSSILALLQQQTQALNRSQSSNDRLTKWLDPTVNVLYAFSETLGEGVGMVFSPAKTIFTGIGVLLLAAKDVRAGQDALVDIFERIETFFRRLEIYTSVPPNEEMVDTITTIMVEVLSILAIATKEVRQGRTKKYLKKLVGRTDIEDALKRLDKLTQEEARMATAQVLRVKVVDDKVATVIDDGKDAKVVMQQTASDVDQVKRNQSRQDLRRWLSPPDPSTNHNIACRAHYKGTATWFFQGSVYNEWKSTASLLWIHGKPGSGKSILCSTIIEDIRAMCNAGQASMGYFYFDFRDISKQHWHDLVPSLLTQLSARSDPRCDILSRFYFDHGNGAQQPSDDTLTQCLKELLTLPDQPPIFLILDALDECPDISGIPSPRDQVLQLVKELVNLHLPNLHICVTSRPEVDIRDVLEPLTSRRVSLHDQTGQKKDIEDYVKSVVYSDSEPIMRRWRKEDKDLVIETLSEQADGMFRWIFCQLESLRHCLPPSVRRTLKELPESLDETYERILKEIKKPNRGHARRVLECLVVAIRPLRVAELAEVLAVDFDDAEGIPKLNADWRWEDQEHALLIACSSLIAIVKDGDSRVVQFSHFSVKEFLTSSRLATASGEASNYHIDLKPAHTTLAQACLGVLLRTQDDVEGHTPEDHPLAQYGARHCTTHAQFEDASSRLQKGMEYLFDPDKPHFEMWRTLYDIDTRPGHPGTFFLFASICEYVAAPLYYAALCGFYDIAEHLIIKHSQDVNANGGYYQRPLLAALAGKHFQTAELLRHNGAGCAGLRLWVMVVDPIAFRSLLWRSRGGPKINRVRCQHQCEVPTGAPRYILHRVIWYQESSVPRPSIFRLLLAHGQM
ncbi:hypothetical protein BJV77DRAFT_1151561 [Russula vinacea]|nr:hypothetical protein BJV77DRAFT_1151561 [Russula vinacea]